MISFLCLYYECMRWSDNATVVNEHFCPFQIKMLWSRDCFLSSGQASPCECCRSPLLPAARDGRFRLQVEGVDVAGVARLAAAVLLWGVAVALFAQPVCGLGRPTDARRAFLFRAWCWTLKGRRWCCNDDRPWPQSKYMFVCWESLFIAKRDEGFWGKVRLSVKFFVCVTWRMENKSTWF